MKIYSSNDILIEKDSTQYVLTFNTDNKYNHFWKNTSSQLEPLKKNITNEKTQIYFKANTIKTLGKLLKENNNTLSYRHAMLLFLCIGDQLNYLEKDKYSVLTYNIDDFVIISSDDEQENSIFLLLNTSHFFPIDNNEFNIIIPFQKNNRFLSPELKKIDSLPFQLNFKSTYYSFALVIINCLNPDILKNDSKNDLKIDDYINGLNIIQDSKLFFALLRCLDDVPENRCYLFI